MITLFICIILSSIWLAYEAWRAPLYREKEDGSMELLRETKKFKDLFKKKKDAIRK